MRTSTSADCVLIDNRQNQNLIPGYLSLERAERRKKYLALIKRRLENKSQNRRRKQQRGGHAGISSVNVRCVIA